MKKRLLALVLTAMLVLSGCGTGDGGNITSSKEAGSSSEPVSAQSNADDGEEDGGLNPVGTYPISDETLELTVMTQQIANIIDIETNKFTEWLQERTNVKINWLLVPQDAAEANLNLTFAGGEYPDIFMNMGINSQMEGLYGGEDKILTPLNDLIEREMPNLKTILDDKEDVRNALVGMDGGIYCLPSIQEYTHVKYAQKMWVNTQWLETLGLDKPETTEDFYQMLKAFKEKDPNGNGMADEVPLSGAPNTGGGWHSGIENFIMNAFIYDSGYYQSELREYVLGDTVDVSINKNEYKDGLKYMNKLYSEGLIDPGAFSNTNDQLKQLALNPDVPILGAAPSGHPAMFCDIVTDHDRYKMYEAIAPLEGPDGYRVATRFDDVATFGVGAISTQCEQPEVAARWLDAFYDYEVSMNRYWGPEGEAWRVAEEGELGLGGEQALYKTLVDFDESAQNESWAWLGMVYTPAELMEGMTVTPENVDLKSAEGFEKMLLTVTEDQYIPYESDEYSVLPNSLRYTEEEAEERNLIFAELQNFAAEYRVLFITGEKDIDAEWDTFVQGLDDMGLQRFLEIENAAYSRYIAG